MKRILVDMRPALDGYSGIPQETRLLFRGLSQLPEMEVTGLLQSGNLVIEPGLPVDGQGRFRDGLDGPQRMDRLSKVVVSLQQGPASHRFEWLRKRWLLVAGTAWTVALSALGRRVRLTGFDPAQFKDFVWRDLFAKTLPLSDFEAMTQCDFRVMRWPWSPVNAFGVATGTLGHAIYPRLDTRGSDIFIAETPYPGRVHPATRMVVRYHDAFPLLMPHTVKRRGYHRAMHFHALQRNAADGAWFACVSESSRRDLLSVAPALASRSVVIPNMVSHHFHEENESPERVPEIIWSRKNRDAPHEGGAPLHTDSRTAPLRYLLMVSTVEPRKNHLALLDAWELLRASVFPDLHLVCVGGIGWGQEGIMKRFQPWLQRGGLHLLQGVPSDDLRLLYRHAQVTVCPSFAEGFDFSGVEAMRSGGVVAGSDIPVHHEIFGDGAVYFSAYAPRQLAECLASLLDPGAVAQREDLRRRGQAIAHRYLPDNVMPQWQAFLGRLAPPGARP